MLKKSLDQKVRIIREIGDVDSVLHIIDRKKFPYDVKESFKENVRKGAEGWDRFVFINKKIKSKNLINGKYT